MRPLYISIIYELLLNFYRRTVVNLLTVGDLMLLCVKYHLHGSLGRKKHKKCHFSQSALIVTNKNIRRLSIADQAPHFYLHRSRCLVFILIYISHLTHLARLVLVILCTAHLSVYLPTYRCFYFNPSFKWNLLFNVLKFNKCLPDVFQFIIFSQLTTNHLLKWVHKSLIMN